MVNVYFAIYLDVVSEEWKSKITIKTEGQIMKQKDKKMKKINVAKSKTTNTCEQNLTAPYPVLHWSEVLQLTIEIN